MAVGGPQLVISKQYFAAAGPTQPVCVGLLSEWEWCCGDAEARWSFRCLAARLRSLGMYLRRTWREQRGQS